MVTASTRSANLCTRHGNITPVNAVPAGLPEIDDRAVAALQEVQTNGAARLLDIDEAGIVAAVGLPPPSGRGAAMIDEATARHAGQRLVERGLAEPAPWALAAFRPIGALLTYAQLATHPKAHVGMVSSWNVPQRPDGVQVIRRVTVLTDVVRGGQAIVELVHKPVTDPPANLPVEVSLLRLDVLVTQICADAAATGELETLVLFADGRGRQDPSRYRVRAGGSGELESSRHGLLGARTHRERTDPDGFAEHLRLRLMAAG